MDNPTFNPSARLRAGFQHPTLLSGALLILASPLFMMFLIPLVLGIVVFLFVADFVSYLSTQHATRKTGGGGGPEEDFKVGRPDTSRASIIIPNWNGRELLEQGWGIRL